MLFCLYNECLFLILQVSRTMDWIIRFYNRRDKEMTTEQTSRQHKPCGKPLSLHPLNYKPVSFYFNCCDHFILFILFRFFLYYFGFKFVTRLVTYDFFGFCSASATTLELRVKVSTTKGELLESLLSDRPQTFSLRENTLTWKKEDTRWVQYSVKFKITRSDHYTSMILNQFNV